MDSLPPEAHPFRGRAALRRGLSANNVGLGSNPGGYVHTPLETKKRPREGAFSCLAERVGWIRFLRKLTLRAACGRLSRGSAALGSNPGGFVHSPSPETKRAREGPLSCLAERVGWIRFLRKLTLRAACGRLSRGSAALGSNPGGFVHAPVTGKHKRARKGPFRIYWRRGWDSNPRTGPARHLISSQARSTTPAPLRARRAL